MPAKSTYMTFLMYQKKYTDKSYEYLSSLSIDFKKLYEIFPGEQNSTGKNKIVSEFEILLKNKINDLGEKEKNDEKTNGPVWEKLVDITEFPDIGTDPEILETTTLSDDMQTFIMGIHGNESMVFNANYDMDAYKDIKKLELKEVHYAVWIGGDVANGKVVPTGNLGRYSFRGQLSVRITGGGVNEILGMSISIAPSTVIKFTDPDDINWS